MVSAINAVRVAREQGRVTLRDIPEEAGIELQATRAHFRAAGITPVDGAYSWDPNDTASFDQARAALK
jgi:hypothetical protein